MSDTSIFGWSSENHQYVNPFLDKTIVKCILLDRVFPASYTKEKIDKYDQKKRVNDAMGMSTEIPEYTHKEGGLAWRYAIIAYKRNENDIWISTLGEKDKLPKYPIVFNFIQYIPDVIKDKNMFGVIKGGLIGGDDKVIRAKTNNKIIIKDIFPNPSPATLWEDGKPTMTADKLNDTNMVLYSDLYQQEVQRVSAWNMIFRKWDRQSEEDAIVRLDKAISSRLLLYEKDSDGIQRYKLPEAGMVFQCGISKRDDSKYFNLLPFEWDKELRTYNYFGNGIEDRDLDAVEQITELWQDYQLSQEANKLSKAQEMSSMVEEDNGKDLDW